MHAAASGMSAQIDLTTQCPLSRGGLGLRGKAPLSAGRQAKGCLQPSFFLAGGEAGGESGKKIYCYWGPSEPPGSLRGDREAGRSYLGSRSTFPGQLPSGQYMASEPRPLPLGLGHRVASLSATSVPVGEM